MTDINNLVIVELDMNDVLNFVREHKKKLALAGLAGLAAGGAGVAYKNRKKIGNFISGKPSTAEKVLSHLKRNKEQYGGAALGATASLVGSKGSNLSFGQRLSRAAFGSALGGALGGAYKVSRVNEKADYDVAMARRKK